MAFNIFIFIIHVFLIPGHLTARSELVKDFNSAVDTLSGKIVCTLVSDSTVYKIGSYPKLHVKITNNTSQTIILARCDWYRFPDDYFEIQKPIEDILPPLRVCGNRAQIHVSNFVRLKPGESFNPRQRINGKEAEDLLIRRIENFRNAGKYKIQYHYSTLNYKNRYYSIDGRLSLRAKHLLKKTTVVDLVSNTVEIEFK